LVAVKRVVPDLHERAPRDWGSFYIFLLLGGLTYNKSMILETVFVEISPENHSKFEAAVKRGVAEILTKSKGFIDFEMHKGIEQPNMYSFLVHWETLEDHTVGFRESEAFPQWRGIIGEYFAKPPTVEHWNSVSIS
jgi:heme-degrading monooxygenase HmoA